MRSVHYQVVDSAEALWSAEAPAVRADIRCKDDLKTVVLARELVPNSGALVVWDGEIWCSWDDLIELPPGRLRVKVVRPTADSGSSALTAVLKELAELRAGQDQLGAGQDQLLRAIPVLATPVLRQLMAGTAPTEARENSSQLRDNVFAYYGAQHPEYAHKIRCCVTGRYLDNHLLTGAHIVPFSAQEHKLKLGFDNIDTPRNMVPWCKPVERAWHEFKICFDGTLTLHILDEALRSLPLAGYVYSKEKDHITRALASESNLGCLTFNDIEGLSMTFNNDNRPMRRCFVFMATAALAWQQQYGDLKLRLPLLNMLPMSPYDKERSLTDWINLNLPYGLPRPGLEPAMMGHGPLLEPRSSGSNSDSD